VSQCESNADCGANQSCAFGVCVLIPSPECVRDANCQPGQVCESDRCGNP
jgi:Cys-rich repeat protein